MSERELNEQSHLVRAVVEILADHVANMLTSVSLSQFSQATLHAIVAGEILGRLITRTEYPTAGDNTDSERIHELCARIKEGLTIYVTEARKGGIEA